MVDQYSDENLKNFVLTFTPEQKKFLILNELLVKEKLLCKEDIEEAVQIDLEFFKRILWFCRILNGYTPKGGNMLLRYLGQNIKDDEVYNMYSFCERPYCILTHINV